MSWKPTPPTHSCAVCHKALWDNRWPYAVCKDCQKTPCKHGIPMNESCGKCDLEGDLAYDASKGN
jgi:hypothetical protein